MKALQLAGIDDLSLVDIPRPTPAADELLVRTGAATVCTSDINDINGNPFGITLPVILGHEGAGTVEEVGREVMGFGPGDRIAAHPVHPCLACDECLRGLGHHCGNMHHFGINMQGVFAEYFVVRHDRARSVGADMAFPAASLAEPVCVCLEALSQARLQSEDSVCVLGDGPFGALIARLAPAFEPARIVIAGRHDFRLSFAGEKATKINVRNAKDSTGLIMEANGGRGYDAVILAVGTQQAVGEGLALLRPKGRLVVFSAVPGTTPVDLLPVHVKELEIVGACNDNDMMDRAVQLLGDPSIDPGALVTHTFAPAQYERALDLAAKGREEAMKVSLVFEGDGA